MLLHVALFLLLALVGTRMSGLRDTAAPYIYSVSIVPASVPVRDKKEVVPELPPPDEPAANVSTQAQAVLPRLLAGAPEYKLRSALEQGPIPLVNIEPRYPPAAGGVQGMVVLRLLINESGAVDDVAIVRASPAGFFEEAAMEAFRTAKFVPGKLLGRPVKSQMTIEVDFQSFNKGAVGSRIP